MLAWTILSTIISSGGHLFIFLYGGLQPVSFQQTTSFKTGSCCCCSLNLNSELANYRMKEAPSVLSVSCSTQAVDVGISWVMPTDWTWTFSPWIVHNWQNSGALRSGWSDEEAVFLNSEPQSWRRDRVSAWSNGSNSRSQQARWSVLSLSIWDFPLAQEGFVVHNDEKGLFVQIVAEMFAPHNGPKFSIVQTPLLFSLCKDIAGISYSWCRGVCIQMVSENMGKRQ